MTEMNRLYRVEHIIIDVHQLELSCERSGTRVTLQNQPMQVLQYLLMAYPRLVTRQELIEQVWLGNNYVGEKALTNAIWQLRSHFEQLGIEDFIQTIRKRGYRLSLFPEAIQSLNEASVTTINPSTDIADHTSTLEATSSTKFSVLKAPRLLILGSLSVIFAFSVLTYFSQREPVSTPLIPVQSESLTTGNGRAQFPDVTNDGEKVVFVWRASNGERNIYWQAMSAGAEKKQLTFTLHRETYPVWDPSGENVVFLRLYDQSAGCGIYQIELRTKRERFLTECRSSGPNYLTAHPLKNEFYFNGPTRDSSNRSNLYRLSLESGEPEVTHIPCTNYCDSVRDFAVSPNGEFLAISRRGNRFSEDIYVLHLASGEEQRLTYDIIDVIGLTWHPNNKTIVFGAAESGKRNAYSVDIETAEIRRLPVDNFGSPSRMLADGTIYYHLLGSRMELSALHVGGETPSAPFPLTLSNYHYRDPHLNPKSGDIVFVSNRSGNEELWVADPDFRRTRKLTSLETTVRFPRWSHSGDKIAFVARYPETQHDVLSVLDIHTGQIELVYQFQQVLGRPTWWHDDSRLVVRENGNLHSFALERGDLQRLTRNGGIFGQSMPSGDLYFTKGAQRGLWKLNADGRETQVIPSGLFNTRYSWVVTPSGVYFYQQLGTSEKLSYYCFTEQTIEGILALPPELVSVQSTFTFDEASQRLIIESWQPRSQLARTRIHL